MSGDPNKPKSSLDPKWKYPFETMDDIVLEFGGHAIECIRRQFDKPKMSMRMNKTTFGIQLINLLLLLALLSMMDHEELDKITHTLGSASTWVDMIINAVAIMFIEPVVKWELLHWQTIFGLGRRLSLALTAALSIADIGYYHGVIYQPIGAIRKAKERS